jgi:protein O-mannosyl-transferase
MHLSPLNKPTLYAIICTVLLMLLIGIAFQDVPDSGFHFDDQRNIVNNKPTRLQTFSLDGVWQAGVHAMLPKRPLPGMSFALDWLRGDGNPRPFLWTNLVIHSANAVLVSILLILLLRAQMPGRKITALWFAPVLLATAIWAIHPIQVQTVSYVVQRMASMATFFSLISLIAYIQGRHAQRHNWIWFAFTGISFAAAMASKENAAIVPLLIIMTEFGIIRHGKPLIRNHWDSLLLALPALLLLYVIVDLLSGVGPLSAWATPGYNTRDFTMSERLLTQPRVVFFHLSQILWPVPGRFSIEHDFALSTGLFSPPVTLAAIAGIFAWVGGALWLLLRHPATRVWGFCLLWVPATLAIESSFISLEMVFEHRMYFPLVGLAGLLALTLQSASIRGIKITALATLPTLGLLLLSLVTTLQRVPDWRSTLTLYESAIPHATGKPRLWANLGSEYFEAGEFVQSQKAIETALRLDPDNVQALETHGSLLLRAGRLVEARQVFQRALAQEKPSDALINQMGFLAVRQGDFPRARSLFLQAATQMPWNPAYIWNAALALERTGDCTQARQFWQHYLSLDVSVEERAQVSSRLRQNDDSPGGRCAGAR